MVRRLSDPRVLALFSQSTSPADQFRSELLFILVEERGGKTRRENGTSLISQEVGERKTGDSGLSLRRIPGTPWSIPGSGRSSSVVIEGSRKEIGNSVREDVRWAYAVHEQILPALWRVNVPVRWIGVTVWHTGYTDPALRGRKLQRECKILQAERPDDPFVLFNLGAIAVERQDLSTALGHLQRRVRGSAPTDSIVRKLFALIARCHQMLSDLPAALGACAEGLSFDPDDAELLFRKAVLHRKAVQPAEADACWRRILTLERPDQFCSVDQGIYGHLTLRNLAVLAEGAWRPGRGPAALADGPRRLPRRPRGRVARGNVTVSRGASRQRSATRCPRLQPERSHSIAPAPLGK